MSEKKLLKTLEKALDTTFTKEINENYWYQDEEARLMPGNYILTEDIASPITGELIAKHNERILVDDFKSPVGSISNINIYRVKHSKTNQDIYISNRDISR